MEIVKMKIKLGGLFAVLAACVAMVTPAVATAAEPWLKLEGSSLPSSIQEGNRLDEVQELSVEASGGEVTLVEPRSLQTFEKTGNILALKYGCMAYDATASEAQAALEKAYGAGNVQVAGGPGGASGGAPYEVTFTGALAGQALEPIATSLEVCPIFGGKLLEGKATATQKTSGRPDGTLLVTVANLGDAPLDGVSSPVVITDELPANIVAASVSGFVGTAEQNIGYLPRPPLACTLQSAHKVECEYDEELPPYETLEVKVGVLLEHATGGEETAVTVAGGGARQVALQWPISTGSSTSFGVESYEMAAEEEGGAPDVQAGSHPFQLTTSLTFKQAEELGKPPALPKDVSFDLPPGLLGNPTVFPQCTAQEFARRNGFANACPNDTAVGVASIDLYEPVVLRHSTAAVPLFNLVPAPGEPARFGFIIDGVPVFLDTAIRTGGDYGVTVSANNITQLANFVRSRVTFWGVPGDPRHDDSRGWSCIGAETSLANAEHMGLGGCHPLAEVNPPPLLSLPASCQGPMEAPMFADSWQQQGAFEEVGLASPMPELEGCNRLPFSPSIAVGTDSEEASTPSGLTVAIHVPQSLLLNAMGLAEASVKNTTVELPEGVTVNPGGGDGLEACSEAQIGYTGSEAPGEDAVEAFTSALPEPLLPGSNFCPEASKIATVKIVTPLLPNPLTGAVYLAEPAPNGESDKNPFKTLLAMYLVAEDPVSGSLVKLPGKVMLNERTGQLVSTFEDTPQLPFEELTLHFFGGERAPLATPALCGSYTTKAVLTPWSGNEAATASSTFDITSGPNGSPCANPRPFSPEFQTGVTNLQAGEYSELRTTMGHPDADQTLGGLKITLPPGLMGSLSTVKLCPEPQASQGTCGPESLIGHTVVTAGLGSAPVVVKRAGDVYITGPYKGAPYGLSIVNPAEAGPFNLGEVVVRAKIEVNPHTAQLTIVSDPLPTILKGIPLDIQHVTVGIDRPNFTFNPTSCAKMKIEGSMTSSEGASVPISTPFQVTNCASLPFTPKFKATTKARHSRKDGAYLHVSVESSSGQADIGYAKVALPKALPSELSTLQHACTEAQFDSNPAGCPAESIVGTAEVHTPVLPVPLKGPAYFVSRGAQWPELIMVLQGYGVTVDLAGETHISNGVTTTTLASVPDVPFTKFSLTLPEQEYSALAGNGNLCSKQLAMPVRFVGQNGKTLEQDTQVQVEGCPGEIAVSSHRVKGKTIRLKVYVPGAGKLQVSGKGLASKTKKPTGRKTVTVSLREKHAGPLKTKVRLAFTPSEGSKRKRQTTTLQATFK